MNNRIFVSPRPWTWRYDVVQALQSWFSEFPASSLFLHNTDLWMLQNVSIFHRDSITDSCRSRKSTFWPCRRSESSAEEKLWRLTNTRKPWTSSEKRSVWGTDWVSDLQQVMCRHLQVSPPPQRTLQWPSGRSWWRLQWFVSDTVALTRLYYIDLSL